MPPPLQFLLISIFLSPLTNSCLLINFPSTTTIPGYCNCEFVALTDENLIEIRPHYFYMNITSSAIGIPVIGGDECSREASCPAGYELVALDETRVHSYGSSELSAICDGHQWLLDDGISEIQTFPQLYIACVDFSRPRECSCIYGDIASPEETRKGVTENEIYKSWMSNGAQERAPLVHYLIEDMCPSLIDCGGVGTYMFSSNPPRGDILYNTELECNRKTRTWLAIDPTGARPDLNLTELYVGCMVLKL